MKEVLPEPLSPDNKIILGEPDNINSLIEESSSSLPTISGTLFPSIGRESNGFPRSAGIEREESCSNTINGQLAC